MGRLSQVRFIVLVLGLLLVGACAKATSTTVLTKQCLVPTDQAATLEGHWQTLPIYVSFHAGDYSASEMEAMIAAADTWNLFFSISTGIPKVIDYGTRYAPRTSSFAIPSPLCAYNLVDASGNMTGSVGIFKTTTGWSFGSGIIARTTYCQTFASPLQNFNMMIVQVNYQNFFTGSNLIPDLQSVLTHEFGHVLGLDHSCEVSRSGFPVCTTSNPLYSQAVMYYTTNFAPGSVNSEVRTSLNFNDEQRANCLYGPSAE